MNAYHLYAHLVIVRWILYEKIYMMMPNQVLFQAFLFQFLALSKNQIFLNIHKFMGGVNFTYRLITIRHCLNL